MNSNRRQSIRISGGNAPCRVRLEESETPAHIIDESIHGLSVGGLNLLILFQDQTIQVEYEGQWIFGRCRSAARDSVGSIRVGILKCDEPSQVAPIRILLNSYIEYGGHKLVCLPVSEMPNEQVVIRFPDGKEFPVNRNTLTQMTRYERLEELSSHASRIESTQKIYRALIPGRPFLGIEDILEQEFGPPFEAMVKA